MTTLDDLLTVYDCYQETGQELGFVSSSAVVHSPVGQALGMQDYRGVTMRLMRIQRAFNLELFYSDAVHALTAEGQAFFSLLQSIDSALRRMVAIARAYAADSEWTGTAVIRRGMRIPYLLRYERFIRALRTYDNEDLTAIADELERWTLPRFRPLKDNPHHTDNLVIDDFVLLYHVALGAQEAFDLDSLRTRILLVEDYLGVQVLESRTTNGHRYLAPSPACNAMLEDLSIIHTCYSNLGHEAQSGTHHVQTQGRASHSQNGHGSR